MPHIEELSTTTARIAELEVENARLRSELDFLRTHTSIAQGMRGETLLAKAIGGAMTSYAEGYDVLTIHGRRIEVKFSKLNPQTQPRRAASIAAMSTFPVCIIASNARLAAARSDRRSRRHAQSDRALCALAPGA